MIISTGWIVTAFASLAGVFGLISGVASQSMTVVPEDGNGSTFLLMVFSALISIGCVVLVHKTIEKETTFSINFNGKA